MTVSWNSHMCSHKSKLLFLCLLGSGRCHWRNIISLRWCPLLCTCANFVYVLNCYICKIWYTNWISNTFLVPLLVNEYKLYVSIQKSSKDAKFGQCLYLGESGGPPLLWAELMRRTEWTSSLSFRNMTD
jgi:hypothetical protein